MNFRRVENPNGTVTLEDCGLGQVMHSRIGPWEEAQLLYIEGSGLVERLALGTPVRIADIGMGIAANAWAAVEAALAIPEARLEVTSFETSLGGIRLALEETGPFPWLGRAREAGALPALLERGTWLDPSGRVHWELREGDYFSLARPEDECEFLFWDFYAPKSSEALWSIDAFRRARELSPPHARLHTYSASTATRAAMMLAGWYVGYGRGTEMKGETTIAALDPSHIAEPLGERWLGKLRSSSRPFPLGERPGIESFAALDRAILDSPHARRYFSAR